jgi:putative hydrolase
MSDLPFGFGPGSGGSGGSGGLPDDLAGKVPLFAELQKLLSWSGGPVNWDLARQVAISQVAEGHSPVSADELRAVQDAVRLADLWLDDATELPSGVHSTQAWSRVEWIERTLPVWSTLCDPVAAHVVEAMANGLPEELRAQAGPMAPIMAQMGGMMFGSQVGQALGALGTEILSSTDIGLPLGPSGVAALVPANIAAFGAGVTRPIDEVRLYLALREAAHQRLFAQVPWLRQRLIDSVDAYARGITIDTSAIQEAVSQIDPTNPESVQSMLSGGMFQPQETEPQKMALRRLETLLALVEGWVDTVVADVAGSHLGGASALSEASRRRRANGGPAEQTFATLVGLELRPRKLREAAALWLQAGEMLGHPARDALWAHPDLLPDSDDLDDAGAFLARVAGGAGATATDDAIAELLDSAANDSAANDSAVNGFMPDNSMPDNSMPDNSTGAGDASAAHPDDDEPPGGDETSP